MAEPDYPRCAFCETAIVEHPEPLCSPGIVRELRAQIERVRALHSPDETPYRIRDCKGCRIPDVAFVFHDRCKTIAALDAPRGGQGDSTDQQTAQHIGNGANAEDCPACSGTNPSYPFICPGEPCPRCEGSMVEPGTEQEGDWVPGAMAHLPYTGEPCTACNGSGSRS
jgi:hypothetical protein